MNKYKVYTFEAERIPFRHVHTLVNITYISDITFEFIFDEILINVLSFGSFKNGSHEVFELEKCEYNQRDQQQPQIFVCDI